MNSALLMFAAIDNRLATHCRLLALRQYELPVRIGVHAHERHAAQRVWFDVDVCVRLDAAPANQDHITATLDYDFIRRLVTQTVALQTHHELQETLCDGVLAQLLAHPGIQAVRVSTRKPDAYPDCASIGIERVATKPWPSIEPLHA